MKIRVTFTVDVDADAWAQEYGVETSKVREDVNLYFRNGCVEILRSAGLWDDGDGRGRGRKTDETL